MGATGNDAAAFADYQAAFSEAPGYLNFASYGPPSARVTDRVSHLLQTAGDGDAAGSDQLHGEDLPSIEEIIRRVDAVTLDDVHDLARTLFSGPETLAVVGPEPRKSRATKR